MKWGLKMWHYVQLCIDDFYNLRRNRNILLKSENNNDEWREERNKITYENSKK